MDFATFCGPVGKRVAAGWLMLWALCTAYIGFRGGDWAFPVIALPLFGGLLPALAWWLTRRTDAPPAHVHRPARQLFWLGAYLLLYAFVLVGWGLGAVRGLLPAGPGQQFLVLAYKLAIHVAIPALLIARLGGSLADSFDVGLHRRGVPLTLLVFSLICFALLSVVSPSLANLAATGVQGGAAVGWVALSWLWLSVEAGLAEEYLFRAGLQSRLSAWLESPLAAILIASTIFALAHWPGLYLRGGPGVDGWSTDPVEVAAFTIASLSPIAIMLGVLWARTRSLLLVVLIHGAIDALPNATEMIRTFG